MRKSLGYEIFMTALVLVIIAGVAGALLGLVNNFTHEDESKVIIRKANAFYGAELKKDEGIGADVDGVVDVLRPMEEGKNTYVLIVRGTGAYKGSLDLFVNITDAEIVKIAVYEANETPGLGSKALKENYFEQYYHKKITSDFSGFDLVKRPKARDDEVSAVTGASKSSTAVTNAVNAAVKWYKTVVLGGVSA